MDFSFKIQEITAGWFDVIISCGDQKAFITNSKYRGNDAPRILIKNVLELCKANSERWLCWHDEPGAYIWYLRKQKDDVRIRISDAVKDSFQLGEEGKELKFEKIGEKYLTILVEFDELVRQLVEEFGKFSSGEGLALYEKEWGEFPMAEYEKLRSVSLSE